ncbi:hypothetical protein CVT24_011797, partial [Panaeolus cyanescens]
ISAQSASASALNQKPSGRPRHSNKAPAPAPKSNSSTKPASAFAPNQNSSSRPSSSKAVSAPMGTKSVSVFAASRPSSSKTVSAPTAKSNIGAKSASTFALNHNPSGRPSSSNVVSAPVGTQSVSAFAPNQNLYGRPSFSKTVSAPAAGGRSAFMRKTASAVASVDRDRGNQRAKKIEAEYTKPIVHAASYFDTHCVWCIMEGVLDGTCLDPTHSHEYCETYMESHETPFRDERRLRYSSLPNGLCFKCFIPIYNSGHDVNFGGSCSRSGSLPRLLTAITNNELLLRSVLDKLNPTSPTDNSDDLIAWLKQRVSHLPDSRHVVLNLHDVLLTAIKLLISSNFLKDYSLHT